MQVLIINTEMTVNKNEIIPADSAFVFACQFNSNITISQTDNTGYLYLIPLWHFWLSIWFLILQHEKVKKLYSQKIYVKPKIFYLSVRKQVVLSMISVFQLLLWSLFAFLEMAVWFPFFEKGPDSRCCICKTRFTCT